MTDLQKGLECCFNENGCLTFYPSGKEIYLYEKTAEELNEICQIIPQCDEVNLESEDLSSLTELKFKDGAVVNFGGAEDLPPNLDISNCAKIDLSGRDLSHVPPQILRENSTFIYTSHLQSGFGMNNLHPFGNNIDVSRCSSVTINNIDLSNASNLKFKDGAEVDLSGCENIPPHLDVSKCDKIYLSECDLSNLNDLKFKDNADISLADCKNVPSDIDITHCSGINLSALDLSEINNLKFAENSDANLSKCKNIPENLDVTPCKNVNLSECDLSCVKNLCFKDGATVIISESKLPQNIDFSNCNEVNLSGCDLSNVKNLKFKDGAKVNLPGCKNIPENFDIRNCQEVNLAKCDLGNLKNLTFKDGAEINLSKCANIPYNTDFSMCSALNLSSCDLSQVNKINFRSIAKVNLQGCTNIPENFDVSMCNEVWLTPKQIDNVTIGNAHVVIGAIGYDKLDFRKLNNFTVSACVNDEILGNSYVSFTGMKEYVFKDKKQYDDFIKNGGAIPDSVTVSYEKETLKEQIKDDRQKAQSVMQKKQNTKTQNSPERISLKTELKKKPVQNVTIQQNQPVIHHVEPNNSINIPKPLIIEKIKRQNG